MDLHDIARMRMARQGITAPRFESAEAVVRWLGAVQAQEYDAARWSLGQRTAGAADASVQRALDEGRILRSHSLRPTWHFTLPEDSRWLIELTAPRVRRMMASYDRELSLDESLYGRSAELIVAAIADRGPLTRNDLAKVLSEAGIEASGQRLTHLLFHAELACLTTSGPRRGKQHTFALLEDRAPGAQSLPREQAVAALARRYFSSRGPATPRDFSSWANLTLTEARRGLEMLGSNVDSLALDGRIYYWLGDAPEADKSAPRAHLLQGYDEYIMSYSESKDVFGYGSLVSLPAGRTPLLHAVLLDGRVAGHWRRNQTPRALTVDLQFYRRPGANEFDAIEDAVKRYGAFVGLPVSIAAVEQPGG